MPQCHWFINNVFVSTGTQLTIDNVDILVNKVSCKVAYGDKEVSAGECSFTKFVDVQNVQIYPTASVRVGSMLSVVASGTDL